MEVKYQPWKTLEIRAINVYADVDALAHVVGLPVPAGVAAQTQVFWANGVLFRFAALANSEANAREHVAGRLIWDTVDMAAMPKYSKTVSPSDKPALTINVLDMSHGELFDTFSKWAKKNMLKVR
jgi:hypothetical protein